MANIKPPKGIRIFAVIKSMFSNTVIPKNLISAHALNDNTVPIPKVQATKQTTDVETIREYPLSTAHATAGSAIDMAEVQEAMATSTKNAVPIITPPGNEPNAIGSDLNNKPGPAVGASP